WCRRPAGAARDLRLAHAEASVYKGLDPGRPQWKSRDTEQGGKYSRGERRPLNQFHDGGMSATGLLY
ncbi:MAG: hypothetical protein O7D91_05885, partial [Planctomycetota bacterium]|nr:hypothetical protein [Planctomycetota bacterium]